MSRNDLIDDAIEMLTTSGLNPTVIAGGKHWKIKWVNRGRACTLVISRSPSNGRARQKSRSLLKRLLRTN
jgi:hypothetical protein